MTEITSAEREAQRIAHLVLEQPRPKRMTLPPRPAGFSRVEWKAERRRLIAEPVRLAEGIEEQVALREAWGGGKGTPQTRARADVEARREGSLARLVRSGAIDAHQLAAAEQIRVAHDAITADVRVRTARLERGIHGGARSTGEEESLAQISRQRAYSVWRDSVAPHAAMLLSIVIDDVALTVAARRWRMSNRRASALLVAALDRWRRG